MDKKQVTKIYDILIVSEDYPGYGGFGTYAYNLLETLAERKLYVALLYFSRTGIDVNTYLQTPNPNIYTIHLPNFSSSVNMMLTGKYHAAIIEKKIIESLANFGLNKIRMAISISPTTLFLVNKFIETKVHIYRMGHIHSNFNKLTKIKNIWTIDQNIINEIIHQNYISDVVLKLDEKIIIIPNSPLTEIFMRNVKQCLNLKNQIHNNMVGLSCKNKENICLPKKYDLIFATSDLVRREKNFALVEKIFSNFPTNKKILVGNNALKYKDQLTNTKIYEYLPNFKLLKKISKSKILILPSCLDAGPSVILEAIISGTIPLMSMNSGFSSLFANNYVCRDMDIKTWTNKIQQILKNASAIKTNKEFGNLINKLAKDQERFFDLIGSLLLESHLMEYPQDGKIKFINFSSDYHCVEYLEPMPLENIKLNDGIVDTR